MPSPTHSHYLVIDFEAACCDVGTVPRDEMQIIEIGAVMADAQFSIVDEFQSFVKPVRHPVLTEFCTRLTSIRQRDIDHAPGFPASVGAFKRWLHRYRDVAFCSWGDYDRRQLRQDCDFHRIPNPISAPHRNVKRLFPERQGLDKAYGLAEAVAKTGMRFIGTHHRGIDDARNIAGPLSFAFGASTMDAS